MKKSIIAIVMVFAIVTALFSGCSRIPKDPPVTTLEEYTYVNPVGETAVADDAYLKKYGTDVKYIDTIENVEFSLNSYYVYGKNAAEMTISYLDYDGVTVHSEGFADIKIIAIGKRADNMKIGYKAYDADGNVIFKSFILIKLDGVKRNEVIKERRFYIPLNATRVVFENYTEPTKN